MNDRAGPDGMVGHGSAGSPLDVITSSTSGVVASSAVPSIGTGGIGDLRRGAELVTEHLRCGAAAVLSVRVGRTEVPTAIVVGGWPFAQPCCSDGGAPDSDEILWAGPTGGLWECERCGTVHEPDYWAMLRLGDGGSQWRLGDPAQMAAAADCGLVDLLAARHQEAAHRAEAAAEAFGGGRGGSAIVRSAGRPFAASNVAGWATVAVPLDDEGSDRGQVAIGYWGARLIEDEVGAGSGRWSTSWRWVEVARPTWSAAQAVQLLAHGPRLASRASEGQLTVRELREAWRAAHGDDVPGWVCSAEAVCDLTRAGLRRRSSKGLGL